MDKESLAKKIADNAVLHGEFTLRSGSKSSWYIDKYLFTTQPDILGALGEMFAKKIPPSTTLLAGAELGGIPLVTAAAMARRWGSRAVPTTLGTSRSSASTVSGSPTASAMTPTCA